MSTNYMKELEKLAANEEFVWSPAGVAKVFHPTDDMMWDAGKIAQWYSVRVDDVATEIDAMTNMEDDGSQKNLDAAGEVMDSLGKALFKQLDPLNKAVKTYQSKKWPKALFGYEEIYRQDRPTGPYLKQVSWLVRKLNEQAHVFKDIFKQYDSLTPEHKAALGTLGEAFSKAGKAVSEALQKAKEDLAKVKPDKPR
jgi:hypothetical protein